MGESGSFVCCRCLEEMEDDFGSDMYLKIQCIDNFRKKQASISPEEHALSDAWHNSLLYALMLEIIRKVLLLGSEGLKNSYYFDLTDGNIPTFLRIL